MAMSPKGKAEAIACCHTSGCVITVHHRVRMDSASMTAWAVRDTCGATPYRPPELPVQCTSRDAGSPKSALSSASAA
jgi:hypothetical protein